MEFCRMNRGNNTSAYKTDPSSNSGRKRDYSVYYIFAVLLIAAITLRLIGLSGSYSYDELCTIEKALGGYSLSQQLEWIKIGRGATPLYRLFLSLWVLFGKTEYIIRLSVVLFSILGLAATYSLGASVFNKRVGLIAVLLLAFSATHIYYSQEIRFYALFGFLCVLTVITLLKFLKKPTWGSWISLVIVHTVSFYSGYYTAFIIIFEFIYITGLLLVRTWLKDYHYLIDFKQYAAITIGFFLTVLLFMPWFIVGALNEPIDNPNFTPFGLSWAIRVMVFLSVNTDAGMILFLSLFFGGVVYAVFRRATAAGLMALIVLGGPVFSLWLVNRSGYFFSERQCFFVLPFFMLLVAAGIDGFGELVSHMTKKSTIRKLIIIGCVIVLSGGLALFQIPRIKSHLRHQLYWRQEWKGVGRALNDHADKNDLIVYAFHFKSPGDMYLYCFHFYLSEELHGSSKKVTDAAWELYERIQKHGPSALPRTIWYVTARSKRINSDMYKVKWFGTIKLIRPERDPANLDDIVDLLGNYPLNAGVGTDDEIRAAIEVFAIFDRYERAFEIAKCNSRNLQFYCDLGNVAMKKGDYEIAKRAYEIAFAERPELPCIPLSDIHIMEKRYSEALRILQVGAKTGKNQHAMVRLGMLYHQLDRPDLAEKTYLRTIDWFPDYVYPHHRLAQLYLGQERYKEALDEFLKVVKLNPEQRSNSLAQCELMADRLVRSGNVPLAKEVYQSILKYEPNCERVKQKFDNPSILLMSVRNLHLTMDDNTTNPTVCDSTKAQHDQEFIDLGGNANTEAHSTTGMVGSALKFDGVDDAININGLAQPIDQDCAIVLWYRLDELPSKKGNSFGNYIWNNSGMFLRQQPSGRIHWEVVYNGGVYPYLTYVVAEDEWNHFVCQRNAGIIELYANCKLVGTYSQNPVKLLNGELFKIGATIYAGRIAFSVDDFRVYDRALLPTEIQALYNIETHPKQELEDPDI
jgi:tetratricopeptide (TPR) repeat protein